MRASLVFLAFGSVSFGLSAVFIKLCVFAPELMASGRMILAGLALLPLALFTRCRRPTTRQVLGAALPGLLLAAHFQLWVAGIKETTAAAGTFLFCMNPVLVAAAERIFRGRRPPRGTLPCLAAIVVGSVWLFYTADTAGLTRGNILCLGATVVFVAYLLVAERRSSTLASALYLPLVYLWGGLGSLPVAALAGSMASAPWADPWAWVWMAALALLPTVVGHGSLMYGVRFHTPLVVSFFTLVEPMGATLFAALFLSELPNPMELPAYALFLVSTAVFLWLRRGAPSAS